VVGGSIEYTGAPYYAATAALKGGGDLSWVLCHPDASIPIKSYSPELIVMPSLLNNADDMEAFLKRIHVLVIGPGLGRDPKILQAVDKLINQAKSMNLPMVIDGDGLFLVAQKPSLVQDYRNVILTPNAVEFKRLYQKVFETEPISEPESICENEPLGTWVKDDDSYAVKSLARALGHVTILQKGRVDNISNGIVTAQVVAAGSPRRCGGQGDILAGLSGLFLHWASSENIVYAAAAASTLTRTASKIAFENHQRSTTTPDILNSIDAAFRHLFKN